MIDEQQLNDYITGLLQGPEYSRLLAKRLFLATITSTTPGAQGTGYLCTVQRPGESGSDGNQYLTISSSYYPVVGDVVECMWRDANVALILGPVNTVARTGAITKIAEFSVVYPTAVVTFSNIPQSFSHLEVVMSTKVDATGNAFDVQGYVNGVNTGSNYGEKVIYADDTVAAPNASQNSNQALWHWLGITTGTAINGPGISRITFANYTTTALFKAYVNSAGASGALHSWTRSACGAYAITDPITSLSFIPASGNFISPSIFSLYGVP